MGRTRLTWYASLTLTKQLPNTDTDSEKHPALKTMDIKTKALLVALELAEECRSTEPVGCICVPCWAKVIEAAKVLDPPAFDIIVG